MLTRVPSLAIAVWLMFLPAVVDQGHAMTTSDRVVGPIAVSAAIVAMGPTTRGVRLLHIPLAAWLVVSALVLPAPLVGHIVVVLTGVALAAAALPGGPIRERHGESWTPVLGRAVELAKAG